MSKVITNTGASHVSFQTIGRRFAINNQELAAPGVEIPLTDQQETTESVRSLIADGTFEDTEKGVRNLSGSYQSFNTDWKLLDQNRQVNIAPGESVVVTDLQAESPAVKELEASGAIEVVPAPDDEPRPEPAPEPPAIDGEGYTLTPDAASYTARGVNVLSVKVTVKPDEGDFSADDKEGWSAESLTGKLACTGISFTAAGVGTFKFKRDAEADLAAYSDYVSISKDGKVFANLPVEIVPVVSATTDAPNLLTTDSPVTITALKVNGIAVDIVPLVFSSSDAKVSRKDDLVLVEPKEAGACVITVSDGKSTAILTLTFTEPAASIGDVYYKTLAAAFKAAASGDAIKLERDVVESVNYTGSAPRAKGFELSVDLNGCEWRGAANQICALRLDYGTVTIDDSKGGGKVTYGRDYAFVVSHVAGDYDSKLVLKSGTFTGRSTVAQCGLTGGSGSNLKYYGGELVVEGGEFVTVPDVDENYDDEGCFRYTLNMLDMVDGKYPGGFYSRSSILVKGGVFHNFNPNWNWSEGEGTDYLADGYEVNEENDVYTVRPMEQL